MCMDRCSSTITSMQKIKTLIDSDSNCLGSCYQVEGNNKDVGLLSLCHCRN